MTTPHWRKITRPQICECCSAPIEAGERAFYYPKQDQYFCSGIDCGCAESLAFTFDSDLIHELELSYAAVLL